MALTVALSALLTGVAWLLTGDSAAAQTSLDTEIVRAYSGVGRIAWTIPATLPHYFAVPHFTMGPRIKCKDEDREECEIHVTSRDIRKPAAERQRQLVDEMRPFVGHSVEGAARIQTAAGDTSVVYVTLTAPGTSVDFRFLTRGYAVKGPGIIHFQHRAKEAAQVERLLDVVRRARAVDALPVWAWRLNDYRLVCGSMFPEHRAVNDAAWAASVFASVDVADFFETAWSMKKDEVVGQLQRAREAFSREFYGEPPAQQAALCQRFPDWVMEAAKDAATK